MMKTHTSILLSCCMLLACSLLPAGQNAQAATPLPTKYYSTSSVYVTPYQYEMTFAIPLDNIQQAVRTFTLANKRQKAGISTVVLFQQTGTTLPIVNTLAETSRPVRFEYLQPATLRTTLPVCKGTYKNPAPPLFSNSSTQEDLNFYLPILYKLMLAHAQLGGKIVICECCGITPSLRTKFVPIEVSAEKYRRLKKSMSIKEGQY